MILRSRVGLSTADLDDVDEPQLHGYLAAAGRHMDELAKLQAYHTISMLGEALKGK